MTTRTELRERLRHLTRDPGPLGSAVCAMLNMDDDEIYVELTSDEVAAVLALLAPQEAREPGPPMRRVRAPKRRICRDCGDTINTGESALRVGDDEVFHVGYQCGCAEKREAARPAPETVRELLGYVVERQRTPGEWVRVWTGRTLWFDHDEAVLERDAYALDGIPARIRGVYLGAPAPAEATPRERKGWEIERNRTNVVCPDCAFSFDAVHEDDPEGGYTCPVCKPAAAGALRLRFSCPLCGFVNEPTHGEVVMGERYQCSECETPLVFSVASPEVDAMHGDVFAPASGEPPGAEAVVRDVRELLHLTSPEFRREAYEQIGAWVRGQREARGMGVREFARACEVNAGQLSAIEGGDLVSRPTVDAVLRYVGTPVSDPAADARARYDALPDHLKQPGDLGVVLPTAPGAPEEGAGE